MITAEQALRILQDTIEHNRRHADYERVVSLANWYYRVITGDGIDALLRQFVRREDEEMFEQRKQLTVAITPAVSETLINPFYRVGRLDNIKKKLTYPDGVAGADRKIEELQARINSMWGGESLDKYFASRFIQLGATDPNAWLVVEFDSFDSRYEKAQPYLLEVSSAEAIHFSVVNNTCEWLIVRKAYSRKINNVVKTDYQYTMYLENDIFQYTPHFEEQYTFAENNYAYWLMHGMKYVFAQYRPKGGQVQAFRTGYKLDMQTQGRTFVNPFHAAMPYFKKTLKAVSEMDLTMSLHAFQQKIQRVEACPGTDEHICRDGADENGGTCRKCLGKGTVDMHTSAQDVITLPFPKRGENDYVKLDDIIRYYSPEVALLAFQDQYIDKLEVKAIKAVYNSDVISKTTIAQTATERIENKDEMYNTLHPFADHFSAVWKKTVRLVAAFTDNLAGLEVVHDFPADYKLKTVNELLSELKQAKDSGASHFVIQQLEKDIAAKLYADDDTAFLKFMVKSRFTPFLGKSEDTIFKLFETGKVRKEDEILWTYSDSIFDELENDVPGFFLLTYERQWPYIQKKVQAIAESLPKDTLAVNFNNEDPTATPVDVELESKAKLKGSVGGTQGILQIQESVANGVTQYEAAVTLLYEIYGFDDSVARKLLGNPVELKAATV